VTDLLLRCSTMLLIVLLVVAALVGDPPREALMTGAYIDLVLVAVFCIITARGRQS
jgi:galactitol-specific phosphotransferase system IIC component